MATDTAQQPETIDKFHKFNKTIRRRHVRHRTFSVILGNMRYGITWALVVYSGNNFARHYVNKDE